ncbi:hypothetical protein [Sporosarcina limicola]|uniref:Lipoprotein n=1 Tax=Sporosarcina limicola TaxID=34101 RepID=A0A927MPD8_9BACL|nr:hypothetical protein [Sporosarcina limicola]MBE1556557.1 hypothetical protein [Sporosarcina limicola]
MRLRKLVYLIGSMMVLTACNSNVGSGVSPKSAVSVEVPDGIQAELIGFDFEDATVEADIIAEVTIKEKIEEVNDETGPYTVFSVVVNQVLNGTISEQEVTIKQEGDSEWTFNDNKMFESGEKYILFLKETVASKSDYWIIGEETGMFKIINDDTIVKLAAPIEEFKDIEIDGNNQSTSMMAELDNDNEKSIQAIDLNKFISKINTNKGGN